MKSIIEKLKSNANDVIKDNNFLIVAYQNRLSSRMVKIFEKYTIPFNKNIINKSIEENLDIYDKLSKKMVKTKEEQEKLNDAIMALHDLTGAEVIDNGDGTYGLKRSDSRGTGIA